MKTFFISYHFSSSGTTTTGFGDFNISGNGIYSMDDVVTVKGLIKEMLVKKGMVDPTIVIISWNEFNKD